MIYLLDTSICILYFNGRSANVLNRIDNTDFKDIVLCSVVKAELIVGAIKSPQPEKNFAVYRSFTAHFTSLPFDDRAADVYGNIRADLEKRGTPIGPNDLMIAAIALAHNLVLVTNNTREFGRVTGLRIEDWHTP
ncbi:MAG TPA: type II toxin-antitoxin system VapC family toxin [Roseiflexaceae bacterium]|nr:type II toxin-antitoxin system VapC family toxin [Roseiflexaceae bacterium]